jgi:hypothetical protein
MLVSTQWEDSAAGRALVRELRQGIALKEAVENRREIEAAHEAAQYRKAKKTVKGLGRHVAEIPQWEFFNLQNKYGYDEVHSKEFVRYLQKKFPHLATSKV